MKRILLIFVFLFGCKSWQPTIVNPDTRDFRYMYDSEYLYPYFDYYDYRYNQNYNIWINQIYTNYYNKDLNKKQINKDSIK